MPPSHETTPGATRCRLSRGSDFEQSYASPVIIRSKGADEESLRRHQSKDGLPRGLNDEAGILKDGRNRRSRGSSDDEGKITPDGLHNEDLRVGGPYLCSFPRETHLRALTATGYSFNSALSRQLASGRTLWSEIDLVLEKHSVEVSLMKLEYHRSVFDPEPEPIPTLSILSTREHLDDDWLSCAREILSLLRREGLAGLNVEIMDAYAFRTSDTFPILQKDPIHSSWNEVLSHLLAHLDLNDVHAVGCYRRGSSKNIGDSAPTVLIIVDVSSKRNWKDTRDLVVGVLDDFGLSMVAVEIVKDRPMQKMMSPNDSTNYAFTRSFLDEKARAAGPLSHESDDSRSGTLGGFVSFREGDTKTLRTYALTCFHCVDPADTHVDSNQIHILKGWREHGIFSGKTDGSLTLRVNHPSPRAIQDQISKLSDTIDQYEQDKDYQAGLECKKQGIFDEVLSRSAKHEWQFMDKMIAESQSSLANIQNFQQESHHVLGEVTQASGYRLKNLHTKEGQQYPTNLDWALISIPQERTVSNRVGDEIFPMKAASPKLLSNMNRKAKLVAECDETELMPLCLRGFRTTFSTGYYSSLKTAKITEEFADGKRERRITLEYTACALPKDRFCRPGDSGALITSNVIGPVVGMLIGGFESLGLGLFTRIDDLFEDIMSQVSTSEINFVVE